MKTHNEDSELDSLRKQVRDLLDKHPTLTSKPICKQLGLNYRKYGSYIDNIRSDWKTSPRYQQGSKVAATFHHVHGFVYVDRLGLDRDEAVRRGWRRSRNKNRGLLWHDKLGRMVWFETGRVNLFVKAPALKGRVYQLFCNGFSMTELITGPTLLGLLLEKIKLKSAHAVFETSKKLPYMVIDLFKLSSGIVVKSGDKSHPNALEMEFSYPTWGERNERLLNQILEFMQSFKQNGDGERKDFYVS